MRSARPARCPSCRSPEMLTVTITQPADAISFTLCACGWKGWARGAEALSFDQARSILREGIEGIRRSA